MFSKYRLQFYAYDLENSYFQTRALKIIEKLLDKLPAWLGPIIILICFLLHVSFSILIAYLLVGTVYNYKLSIFVLCFIVSLYYISKFRFQIASKEMLLDFIEKNSFEITLFEELIEDKEIHFLQQRQINKESSIIPNDYLKTKLGSSYSKFNLYAFKKIYRNQETDKLDDFIKGLD